MAETLSYIYIDTGAMYRALTYKALSQGINFEYESELHKLLSETEIELVAENKRQIVYLDGSDVTDEIRSAQVTNSVSIVSSTFIRERGNGKTSTTSSFRWGSCHGWA